MKPLAALLTIAGIFALGYLGFRWAVIDAASHYLEVVGAEGCTSVVDMRRNKFLVTCRPQVIINEVRTYHKGA